MPVVGRSPRSLDPAARIGWALMGSTISVAVGVSVRVGARARSDPTIPADALSSCLANDPSAWLGHLPDTHLLGGVTY
jgi:hypothetical protein